MFRNPTTDLIVVLVIVLLIFGPKRLPGLGRSLGSGLREFKDSITGDSKHDEAEDRPAITTSSAATATQPAPSGSAAQAPEPQPVEQRTPAAQPAGGGAEQQSAEPRS
jgi:sec-independent protein translocase protein TatA